MDLYPLRGTIADTHTEGLSCDQRLVLDWCSKFLPGTDDGLATVINTLLYMLSASSNDVAAKGLAWHQKTEEAIYDAALIARGFSVHAKVNLVQPIRARVQTFMIRQPMMHDHRSR
jgi:hypothetical protein